MVYFFDLKIILKVNKKVTKSIVERIRKKRKESYMSKLKGLWIPLNILLNEELSDKEKIVLSMISYLSDETGSCFASNKYIASIVNVTSDRVSKIVSSLKKKGYIEVRLKFKKENKEVESRQIILNKEKLNEYSEKYLEGIGENNYLDSQKQLHPIGENNEDIIII